MNLIQIKNKIFSFFNPSYIRNQGDGFFQDISKWIEEHLEGKVFSSTEFFNKIVDLYDEGLDCPVFSTKVTIRKKDWFKYILESVQKTLDSEGVAYLTHSELVVIICEFYDEVLSKEFQKYVCLQTGGFYYPENFKTKIANLI